MRTMWKLAAGAAVCLAMAIVPAEATLTCDNLPGIGPPPVCHYEVPNDNSVPTGFYWTQVVANIVVEHDTPFCPEHLCNVFSARISNRKASWNAWAEPACTGEGPVVLFQPGDGSNNFFSDAEIDNDDDSYTGECNPEVDCHDPPEGIRLLQQQLWDAGARILEVRYKCPMLSEEVEFYTSTQSCQHTLLTSVLKKMLESDITEHPPGLPPVPTSESWWPEQAECRFAYGASEGETQLMFAIEAMSNADDGGVGVMNRVVYGGGGAPYDLRGSIHCPSNEQDDLLSGCVSDGNDACKNLEQVAFLFEDLTDDVVDECGGCWTGCDGRQDNCQTPNDQTCQGDPDIEGPLDAGSISTYVGEEGGDDQARILGAVLVNTGQDSGLNQLTNTIYLDRRDSMAGSDTNEATWVWTDCVCDCPFWGHGTLNRTYAMFKDFPFEEGDSPVDDWTQFFVSGDLTFDLYDLAEEVPDLCAQITPDCQTVAPPDAAVHAVLTCTTP